MLKQMIHTFTTRRWPDLVFDWSTLWSEEQTTPALAEARAAVDGHAAE